MNLTCCGVCNEPAVPPADWIYLGPGLWAPLCAACADPPPKKPAPRRRPAPRQPRLPWEEPICSPGFAVVTALLALGCVLFPLLFCLGLVLKG